MQRISSTKKGYASTVIFEHSISGRQAHAQSTPTEPCNDLPSQFLRTQLPRLPECSELQVVRHYTKLSKLNFSIDSHFYPLGSCTMKYNPRGVHKAASLDAFQQRHPLMSASESQGFLHILHELQHFLAEITGLPSVCLSPMAGSQGEFAGVAMIKAYHHARCDQMRDEILIPDAAHGTNPASAIMCGLKVIEIPTSADGDLNIEALKSKLGPKTAGIMLTNPSTLGLFISNIQEVATLVHQAGGLLYYDGANLNAILGKVKPGDMGFDVMHINLHKTFATPHGGGGPGAGPIAVSKRLLPFLPIPIVLKEQETYRWSTTTDFPQSIGRLSCFMGNAAILLRAYFYICVLGQKGLTRVSEHAALNANYLMHCLSKIGYTPAYPKRLASHEFIITLSPQKKAYDLLAIDFAKRLLDYGFHAPTTYFPLLVPECLLIEPTETEPKETLDAFVEVMKTILEEAQTQPDLLKQAPHTLPVRRLDDVKAARELDLNYYAGDKS